MKKITTLVFAFILFQTNAQIIDIQEITSSNEKLNLSKLSIVDINSSLQIKLNKDSLNLQIGNVVNTNPELTQEINLLNTLLKDEIKILKLLQLDFSRNTPSEQILISDKFSKLMLQFINAIQADTTLKEATLKYINEYYKLPSAERKKYGYYYPYVIKKITADLETNITLLKKSINKKKVQIQMVAFLNTKSEQNRKIHIENFDSYSTGEFYNVPRWVTSFSKDDVTAFNQSKELAGDLNSLIGTNFEEIKKFVLNHVSSISCYKNIALEIDSLYNNRNALFQNNTTVVENLLNRLKEKYQIINTTLSSIKALSNNKSSNSNNTLENFNSNTQKLSEQIIALPEEIKALFETLPKNLKTANSSILALKSKLETCNTDLKTDFKKVEDALKFSSGIFAPFKKTAKVGGNIGKEVLSYGIKDLPKIGYIDLKTTGKRENGAELKIKLIVKTEKDSLLKTSGTTIEQQNITLRQINIHTGTNVSVILASPYNYNPNTVNLKNKFQFAPSANLLFKWGSRTSKTWNFINPGIGFNISTPDFDLDGAPEVGMGGVVTLFNDIVSSGVSYNTKTNNPYWFFGLSLPFSSLGLSINAIKTATK